MIEVKVEEFNILVEENEKHIQINDVQEVERIILLIKDEYKNYQVDFCYHNNVPPKKVLESNGAVILDDSLEMILEKREQVIQIDDEITQVTKDSFELFAKYHDSKHSNMYWNSNRIFKSFDDWIIFVIMDKGDIVGYVLTAIWDLDTAEVYALVAPNNDVGITLLSKAVQDAFSRNHRKILFMAEKDSLDQICSLDVGFKEKGFYQSYRLVL